MKQLIISLLFAVIFFTSQAKDTESWKNEPTLKEQYETFKGNLNYWNGSYFLKESQLSSFYTSLSDTINKQKEMLNDAQKKNEALDTEIEVRNGRIADIQEQLDKSQKYQNSISFFGLNVNKHFYSVILFLIIAGTLVLAGFVFLLYKKSLVSSRQIKKDYDDLHEEYEAHKKNALERYTQINMELHRTRLELQKKK